MPTIHPGYPTPLHLHPVMYWGSGPGERPQDSVDPSVPAWRREALAFVLGNGVDAHPGTRAMGWASCRICGARLGSADLSRLGFVWPEGAEHYVLAHGVWTPECSALLERALARGEARVGSAPPATPAASATAAALLGQRDQERVPWYFEKTGPAFFNEWSVTHFVWGALYQLFFPDKKLAGLVLHTIYEAIEGHIFPAEFRDVSARNHVGDTVAFAVGMAVIPAPSERSPTDMVRLISEARSQAKR